MDTVKNIPVLVHVRLQTVRVWIHVCSILYSRPYSLVLRIFPKQHVAAIRGCHMDNMVNSNKYGNDNETSCFQVFNGSMVDEWSVLLSSLPSMVREPPKPYLFIGWVSHAQ